jgi:hypothetical protein
VLESGLTCGLLHRDIANHTNPKAGVGHSFVVLPDAGDAVDVTRHSTKTRKTALCSSGAVANRKRGTDGAADKLLTRDRARGEMPLYFGV